jgi:hypothetical protein
MGNAFGQIDSGTGRERLGTVKTRHAAPDI